MYRRLRPVFEDMFPATSPDRLDELTRHYVVNSFFNSLCFQRTTRAYGHLRSVCNIWCESGVVDFSLIDVSNFTDRQIAKFNKVAHEFFGGL